jgi:chaperone modulatory protein CbpM
MKRMDELVASITELRREDLEDWIGRAMVRPSQQHGEPVFGEAEFARVNLICTLRYDLDIETDTLPILLDLIDQLHETRHRLHAIARAVLTQDEKVRRAVLEILAAEETD